MPSFCLADILGIGIGMWSCCQPMWLRPQCGVSTWGLLRSLVSVKWFLIACNVKQYQQITLSNACLFFQISVQFVNQASKHCGTSSFHTSEAAGHVLISAGSANRIMSSWCEVQTFQEERSLKLSRSNKNILPLCKKNCVQPDDCCLQKDLWRLLVRFWTLASKRIRMHYSFDFAQ